MALLYKQPSAKEIQEFEERSNLEKMAIEAMTSIFTEMSECRNALEDRERGLKALTTHQDNTISKLIHENRDLRLQNAGLQKLLSTFSPTLDVKETVVNGLTTEYEYELGEEEDNSEFEDAVRAVLAAEGMSEDAVAKVVFMKIGDLNLG